VNTPPGLYFIAPAGLIRIRPLDLKENLLFDAQVKPKARG